MCFRTFEYLWRKGALASPLLLAFSTIASTMAGVQPDVMAQVVADGTLSTTVTSSDTLNFVIEDGDIAGTNLFHSFEEFSVPSNGSAIFNNSTDIQTIFSRVTGANPSNIDGLIQTNGSANLFLLNPNGIVFGPNAQLNLGGSFLGSTADSFLFEDGFEFSATDPTAPPLLSITTPTGLQYGTNPGSITIQSRREDASATNGLSGLSVPSGHSLGLIGGRVKIDGGVLQGTRGDIELGSVGPNSEVRLSALDNRLDQYEVSYDDTDSFSNIRLTNDALISSEDGGGIQLRGDRIRLSQDSTIATTTTNVDGGNIELEAQRRITVDTGARLYALTDGPAKGGDIQLQAARRIALSGIGYDELLQDFLVLVLNGGDNALAMPAQVTTLTSGIGDGGRIKISTAALTLDEGMRLSSFSLGGGNAQNITISASSHIALDQSIISSNTDRFTTGNGGDIIIATPFLRMTDGANINASALGEGLGGDVTVEAEAIEVHDTRSSLPPLGLIVLTTIGTSSLGLGDAGDTLINTQTLSIQGGAAVAAASLGQINPEAGAGGNIEVNATDWILLDGVSGLEGIKSEISTLSTSDSPAGNIEIATGTLTLRNGAEITSDAQGTAPGGDITIVATEGIEVTGAGQFADSTPLINSRISSAARPSNIDLGLLAPSIVNPDRELTGDAGNLSITTPHLWVNNGGRVAVSSETSGVAGDLRIEAERIILEQDGAIIGATEGGEGGKLLIHADDAIFLSDQSAITSSASESASGESGDIQIQTGALQLTDSRIEANNLTLGGRGGNIDIVTQQPLTLNRSTITATTASGDGGDLMFRIGHLLLLEGNSLFSTTAGQDNNDKNGRNGGGNGGNIDIRTPLLIAPAKENNDITANAFTGNGGNIIISTQGLFGLDFRDRLTAANDITASSAFGINGTVEINNPEADPNSQVLELPETLVDISLLVRPGCSLDEDQFVLAGRGGLPDSPLELMNGDRPWFDLRDLSAFVNNSSDNLASIPTQQPRTIEPLQEATGMKITANGTFQLVTSHVHNRILPPFRCTSQTNFL